MNTFRVKNFETFQHYKDRSPPWIKLYNELLDDYEFGLLPDATKMHLVAIWLLASRSENKIPFDPTWVARRINANTKVDLALLAERGFILVDQQLHKAEQIASTQLAKRLSREREETEESRAEVEKKSPLRVDDDWPKNHGDLFWQAYPRKTEKLSAMKKLATLRKSGIVTFADLMAGVNRYAASAINTEPRFIKQPTTWLNAGCWADELQPGGGNGNRSGNTHATGHDAILAAATRRASKLSGDSELAGTTNAAEFPFGDGAFGRGEVGRGGAAARAPDDRNGRQSDEGRVREGEIIPADEIVDGVSFRRH